MKVYNENEIQSKLDNLKGWDYMDGHIGKSFTFADFKAALSFVNKVGFKAEEMNHHPDILIYAYNKVNISLQTHSEKGITDNDFNLAYLIEASAHE